MSSQAIVNKMDEAADGVMSKSTYEYYFAQETIAIGETVSLDLSQTDGNRALNVVLADIADTNKSTPIGVATHAAVSGDRLKVCVGGYFEGAVVSTSTAKGDLLQIGGTAGKLDVRVIGVNEGGVAIFNLHKIVASALEDDTTGLADIWIYPLVP